MREDFKRLTDFLVRMGVEQRFWQSSRFAAEDKYVASLEARLGIEPCRRRAEQPRRSPRQPSSERCPVIDCLPFEMLPVVEPRAPHCMLVDPEAQLAHQMQRAARGCAQARHVARVGGNFRLHEHDVEGALNGLRA